MEFTLSWIDILIIIIYFTAVLGVGFYLKSWTRTGNDFFLAPVISERKWPATQNLQLIN